MIFLFFFIPLRIIYKLGGNDFGRCPLYIINRGSHE